MHVVLDGTLISPHSTLDCLNGFLHLIRPVRISHSVLEIISTRSQPMLTLVAWKHQFVAVLRLERFEFSLGLFVSLLLCHLRFMSAYHNVLCGAIKYLVPALLTSLGLRAPRLSLGSQDIRDRLHRHIDGQCDGTRCRLPIRHTCQS